jgi:hypothetical protein
MRLTKSKPKFMANSSWVNAKFRYTCMLSQKTFSHKFHNVSCICTFLNASQSALSSVTLIRILKTRKVVIF